MERTVQGGHLFTHRKRRFTEHKPTATTSSMDTFTPNNRSFIMSTSKGANPPNPHTPLNSKALRR
eukprot:2906604-Amphidinium_carterae.1